MRRGNAARPDLPRPQQERASQAGSAVEGRSSSALPRAPALYILTQMLFVSV